MASNPLTDVLPVKARKYAYAAAFLALLVYTAVQAAQGDLLQALGSLLTSLVPLLAASNTKDPQVPAALADPEDDLL
jgi:hypothetical protein